jgi:hypothetical protein
MLQLNARLTQPLAASVQPISIPQAKTSNRLPGLLRDRNGFPASICLVPRPGPPSSISPPPTTQHFPILDLRAFWRAEQFEASAAKPSYSLS